MIQRSNVKPLALLIGAVFVTSAARADFATIINLPPNTAPTVIGSNTQVNVLPGGALGNYVDAGLSNGGSTNIEVNIAGGSVGAYFDAYYGTTVNFSAGTINGGFNA